MADDAPPMGSADAPQAPGHGEPRGTSGTSHSMVDGPEQEHLDALGASGTAHYPLQQPASPQALAGEANRGPAPGDARDAALHDLEGLLAALDGRVFQLERMGRTVERTRTGVTTLEIIIEEVRDA